MPGLDFGYSYDGMGNRLSASKGTPALVTEYEPDAMNRYASITSPGGDDILVKSDTPVDVEMDETPVGVTTSGNFRSARITATNSTAPAFPEISITGEDNFAESGHRWIPQAEFSPTYDDDGNLTNDGRWIYSWDAMNRLTGMTPTTAALTAGVPNQSLSFAYDHLSRRIAKKVTTIVGENTTVRDWRYHYEGWNVVAQFTADTSNDLTPDATYLWSLDLSGSCHGAGGVGGLHSVNLLSQAEAAKLCLACYDANGNIIAWTDPTGRVLQRQDYDPFGNRVIRERFAITAEQSNRLEYGFSTKHLDAETGFIYYIFRYYGTRDGRWLSKDPIGEAGGLNLYGMVGNGTINQVDPLGLDRYVMDWGKHHPFILFPETEEVRNIVKHETVNITDLIRSLQREIDQKSKNGTNCGTVGDWMNGENYRNSIYGVEKTYGTEVKRECRYTGRWIRVDFAAIDTMYTAAYIRQYSATNPEIEALAWAKNALNVGILVQTGMLTRGITHPSSRLGKSGAFVVGATAFGFINLTVVDDFDPAKIPEGAIKIQSSCDEDMRALTAWLKRAESAYFATDPLLYNTACYNCRHWVAQNIHEGIVSAPQSSNWQAPFLPSPTWEQPGH